MKHAMLLFLLVASFSFYFPNSFAQLLPGDVNSQYEWASLETCTVGTYGNYFGLGSWSIDVIENKPGLCKLNYSFEIEMGYQKYDCQIPTNYLKTIDWNSDHPPIFPDLVEQYCTVTKSGNAINDLAFYWYLAIFAMIASTIGIGASILFMIRKLRKQKKNN